jgi:hypothetical protein
MKRKIGLLTAVALSGAAYAQDVKVGGYVDGGFNWTKDGAPETSFVTNDWALTLSGNSGGSFAFVEVSNSPLIPGALAATQFYGGHKYDNGFSWKVGAFNGLLGSEDNESVNRAFIHEGLVSGVFYATYGGLHLGYAASDSLNVDLVIGNGEGTFGPTPGLDPTMWALKVSTKMDDVTAYAGTEVQKGSSAKAGSGTDGETGYKIDVGASAKMGELHAGAEVAMVKAAVANADSGFGFGVHAGYDAMENVALWARFDWGNKTFVGGAESGYSLTVGPTFKMSDAFNLRAQWTMAKAGTGADAAQMIDVMGVYKF